MYALLKRVFKRTLLKITIPIALAVALEVLILTPIFATASDVIFIVNRSVNKDTISKEEIKNIFTGVTTKWPDQKPIYCVVLKTPEVHKLFTQKYVKKSVSQFTLYWRNQVFTGQGIFPRMFKSEEKVIDYVAQTEGAIGYVSPLATFENVKVITVKGSKGGE